METQMPEGSSPELPLVAIVTPVYNGDRFLAEAMDCVQAQTYENLVHIVLDNASTDQTPAILARYRNTRVPVIVHRNATLLPLTPNWNVAVSLIPESAKYFRILCADDLITPDYVERSVELGERHPNVGIIGCLVHVNDLPPFPIPWARDQEVVPGREVLRRYFRAECYAPTGHAFIRCTELQARRPFFDENVLINDLLASLEVLARSDMGFVHADMGMTRVHEDTVSNTFVNPTQIKMAELVYLTQRFCPIAYGRREATAVMDLFRRYYLRQLLKWRLGKRAIYEMHVQRLRELGVTPRLWQFVDAVVDWALVRLKLRPVWMGYW
jgi:glycosyltransferase involved in cell wall biosynthesis